MTGKLGPTPAARRARSACAISGSAARAAALRARLAAPVRVAPRPRPSSCSRSPSTSLVCSRPRRTKRSTRFCASLAVIWPRSTASVTASSMRSRVSIIRSSGRTRLRVSASRSSAAVLPANSVGAVAVDAALRARRCAVCWRPRAWPPRFAAVSRVVLLFLAPFRFA